jgi:predicted CoA-binding protein
MTIHSAGSGDLVDPAIEQDALRDIYATIHTIAAVGASANEAKEANAIPAYLASQGFHVVAVSPRPGELFGGPVAPSLDDVPVAIDVVDVFRPAVEAAQVAANAVAAGASILWFQPGTASEEGIRVGVQGGLTVVSDRCMGATHRSLGLMKPPR